MPVAQQQLLLRLIVAAATVVVRSDPGVRGELVSLLVKEHQGELVDAVAKQLAA